MSEYNWPPLESDPQIFTDYMNKVGMSADWGFTEIFGLDEDLLGMVPQPCVAVIAAIERNGDDGKQGDPEYPAKFYMKQTGELDNACGIIACIHPILNNQDQIELTEGSILHGFAEDTAGKTPQERAAKLESFTEFKELHAAQA